MNFIDNLVLYFGVGMLYWADLLCLPMVRFFLFVFCLFFSAGFLPFSLFGVFLVFDTLFSDAPDRFFMFGWGVLGLGGFFGIVAAWVRLFVPRVFFREKAILRWIVIGALSVGLLVAVVIIVGEIHQEYFTLMGWLSVVSVMFGIFLIGATLGES